MSRPVDVLAVYVAGAPLGRDDLTASLAAFEKLVETARRVNEYLGGFEDAYLLQNAAFKSRAQLLRDQADAIERKESAISDFRAALLKATGEGA